MWWFLDGVIVGMLLGPVVLFFFAVLVAWSLPAIDVSSKSVEDPKEVEAKEEMQHV